MVTREHYLSLIEARELLRQAVGRERGGAARFAEHHGFSRVRVSRALSGAEDIGGKLARALGIQKAWGRPLYRRIEAQNEESDMTEPSSAIPAGPVYNYAAHEECPAVHADMFLMNGAQDGTLRLSFQEALAEGKPAAHRGTFALASGSAAQLIALLQRYLPIEAPPIAPRHSEMN